MATMSCWEKFCDGVGVGCCIDEDEFRRQPLAEITQNEDRHCTDVPCLLAMIFVFVFEFYLIIYASGQGADVDFLLHGYDYKGDLCTSDNSAGKWNAWPDLMSSYDARICVSSCSQTTKAGNDSRVVTHYTSQEFLGAWCLPTGASLKNLSSSTYDFDSVSETYERAVSDLATCKWLILVSAFLAIIFSFLFLKIISCVASVVIWLTIIIFFAGGFMLSYFLIEDGQENMNDSETEDTGKLEFYLGITVAIIMGLLGISMLWCRKRIDLAIEMLHEAAHAIRDMKTTVLFPVLYSFVGIGYMALWVAIALYIYSVKSEKTGTMPDSLILPLGGATEFDYYEFDTSLENMLVYHFICLWYVVQLLIYFGFMVLAGVIADWYFSDWDMTRQTKIRGDGPAQLSTWPVLETVHRVLRFHMGSLAFGAALITIVRVIRAVVTYIEKKTKAAENPVGKCLFCCVKCCLRCCECIIDKISKEGFIFTSIYGTGFCYSSLQVLKLLWSNVGRAAAVSGVSRFMEVFGRIAIASCVTGLCLLYLNIDSSLTENVSSVVYPCVVIFVISYVIGSHFMMVLEVGVDAIFLCFLVDEAVHGTPKFASNKMYDMVALNATKESQAIQANSGGSYTAAHV